MSGYQTAMVAALVAAMAMVAAFISGSGFGFSIGRAKRCDCGRPLAEACIGCVEEEYQAAHRECPICCIPAAMMTDRAASKETTA